MHPECQQRGMACCTLGVKVAVHVASDGLRGEKMIQVEQLLPKKPQLPCYAKRESVLPKGVVQNQRLVQFVAFCIDFEANSFLGTRLALSHQMTTAYSRDRPWFFIRGITF